jgi:hypothetical protein
MYDKLTMSSTLRSEYDCTAQSFKARCRLLILCSSWSPTDGHPLMVTHLEHGSRD